MNPNKGSQYKDAESCTGADSYTADLTETAAVGRLITAICIDYAGTEPGAQEVYARAWGGTETRTIRRYRNGECLGALPSIARALHRLGWQLSVVAVRVPR